MAAARPGVVVWELQKSGRWRPYSPEVSQALEKAYKKNFSQLLLTDADPKLMNYYVNLHTMTQHTADHTSPQEWKVRRKVYRCDSPAATGARWEWAGEHAGVWHEYMMDIQCLIEDEWGKGNRQDVDISKHYSDLTYRISIENLTQVNTQTGFVRNIRRLSQQARYPTVKEDPQEMLPVPSGSGQKDKGNGKKSKGKTTKDPDSPGKPSLPFRAIQTIKKVTNGLGGKSLSNKNEMPPDSHSVRRVRRGSGDTTSTYLSQDSESKDNLMDLDEPPGKCTRAHPTGNRPKLTDYSNQPSTSGHTENSNKRKRMPSTMETNALVPMSPAVELLMKHCSKAMEVPMDELCPICQCTLHSEDSSSDSEVFLMNGCGHMIHFCCLVSMIEHHSKNSRPSHLQCPSCMTIYGVKIGNQPEGTLTDTVIKESLPGFKGCRTIQITYNFKPGIQGPEHPHPGNRYAAFAFPRIAYLPDNETGRKVLRLLKVAFDRRLVFTIGQSVTTGLDDVITWNEIHHKTSIFPNTAHGYPDPNYLDNILMELAAHGVAED